MAKKQAKKSVKAEKPTSTEVAVVPEEQKRELVLEGDPQQQLEYAQKAASALMKVVAMKDKKVVINGKEFLEFPDWQTLGRFFGGTVATEWTQEIVRDGQVYGYEAAAIVYHNGVIISRAEAMCTRGESKWRDRDEYAVRSMAQTRAGSKALRNAYGWVARLAGYRDTPAEEMDGVQDDRVSYKVERVIDISDDEPGSHQPKPIEKMTPKEQKTDIFALLKALKHEPKDKKDAEKIVLKLTSVDLVEENYPIIIERLRLLWDEANGR